MEHTLFWRTFLSLCKPFPYFPPPLFYCKSLILRCLNEKNKQNRITVMTFIRSDNVFLFQLISLAYVNVPEAEGRRFHLWPQQLNENKAHPFIHSHCTCFWSHESQAVSSSCVSPTNNPSFLLEHTSESSRIWSLW